MIFSVYPQKDTYVNNVNLESNNGELSNVGKSSTLDLFKLYNENKHSFSRAFLQVTSDIVNNQTLTLKDSSGITKTFIFKTGENFVANALEGDNIKIGMQDLIGANPPDNFAIRIRDAINAVSDISITAFANSNNDLILKQDISGEEGDTEFTLPANGITSRISTTKFARVDFSAVLVKFDTKSFIESYIDPANLDTSLFNDIKVLLSLKDVTTGLSKPKNYKLSAYKLRKDFKEGLGSDVIYFSDVGVSNFVSLSDTESWEIPSFISDTDIDETQIGEQEIIEGDENLSIDITTYFKSLIADPDLDKGLLITFKNEDLFDENSYFVKRFGSRHLINLKLRPEILILADDSSFKIGLQKENVVRSFNVAEDFYLINNQGGQLVDFSIPAGHTLKAKIIDRNDNSIVYVSELTTISNVKSQRGIDRTGIKKGTLGNTQLDFYSDAIQNNIVDGKLKTELIWFAENDNDATDIKVIKKVDVDFLNSISEVNNLSKHIVVSVSTKENELYADNSVYRFSVYFNDPKLDNSPVKTPISLSSLNIGNTFYSVIDADTKEILLNYHDTAEDKFATKMFFDGEKYVFDFQLSQKYKNRRINFNFKNKDILSENDKVYSNSLIALKVN